MKINKEKLKNTITLIVVLVLFIIIASCDVQTCTSDADIKEAQQTAIENIDSKK